ncbi:unnamed protein product [Penicillium salamii]|uniref:Ubiquitin 3 binding protein But2 C-terminal domain-containing protein n=1 Tax=Penicillium salamii TaxID=1612424 RepID=A0A9W4NKS1_9EURO|nr:unnamed protein product [Penicillium salamii]CAG8110166.1 unnamed protein product [Penicillium salamii]CAG8332958.1 unnamed protein product [Penicillium salamii]CAG8351185.1 unnamed protein product [Penicillium salamii]CAG8360493.1 unnamed protein product [Penicillium salamii]
MMKNFITLAAFAAGANALVGRSDSCCFHLTSSGGASGEIGQLSDGQNRVGDNSLPPAQFCIDSKGAITDAHGRGCILTPPTTQLQCDEGASPTSGFSVNSQGQLEFQGSKDFVACATGQNGGLNIYTSPNKSDVTGCVNVELSADSCSNNGSGSGSGGSSSASAGPSPAQSTPAGSAPTPEATGGSSSGGPGEGSGSATPAPSGGGGGSSPSSPSSGSESSAPAPSGGGGGSSPSSPGSGSGSGSGSSPSPVTVVNTITVTDCSCSATSPGGSGSSGEQPAPSASMPAPSGGGGIAPSGSAGGGGGSASVPSGSQPSGSGTVPSSPGGGGGSQPSASGGASVPGSSASSTPSSTENSCPTTLTTGSYETPHLIIPVDSSSPKSAPGTSFNGTVSSTVSSAFNFDIPSSDSGKTCSLVFLFPKLHELETSSFSFAGNGQVDFAQLSTPVDKSTSFSSLPSISKDFGDITVSPGNSYVISTFACPAGETVAFEMKSSGNTDLNFFQDWNPSPIGLFITTC